MLIRGISVPLDIRQLQTKSFSIEFSLRLRVVSMKSNRETIRMCCVWILNYSLTSCSKAFDACRLRSIDVCMNLPTVKVMQYIFPLAVVLRIRVCRAIQQIQIRSSEDIVDALRLRVDHALRCICLHQEWSLYHSSERALH